MKLSPALNDKVEKAIQAALKDVKKRLAVKGQLVGEPAGAGDSPASAGGGGSGSCSC
jgi:hypothetical protein